MPSLPTDHSNEEKDAFRKYLPLEYTETYDSYISNQVTILFSFFSFLLLCTLGTTILLAPNYLIKYIVRDIGYEYYYVHNYSYIEDYYWYTILSLYCFIFIYICYRKLAYEHYDTIFKKCFDKHWKLSLYLISFVVNVLFIGSMNEILLYYYLYYYNNKQQVILTLDIFCDLFQCKLMNFYWYFFSCVAPSISLFLCSLLIHVFLFGCEYISVCNGIKYICCCPCYCMRYSRLNNGNNSDHIQSLLSPNDSNELNINGLNETNNDLDGLSPPSDINKVELDHLQPTLSPNDFDDDYSAYNSDEYSTVTAGATYTNSDLYTIHEIIPPTKPKKKRRRKYKHSISRLNETLALKKYPEIKLLNPILYYCIVLSIVYFGMFMASNLKDNYYNEKFEYIYIYILFFCHILKWLLKRIGRIIDYYRVSQIKDENLTYKKKRIKNKRYNIKTMPSVELYTELFMSSLYWLSFRELLMYKIPTWPQFIITKAIHMLIEIYHCSVRPSTTYYDITTILLKRSKINNNKNIIYKFLNINDDSTLFEWRIRCSLDITMKFMASIISTIIVLIEVLMSGNNKYILNKTDYNRGLYYNIISVGIESGYFILAYIIFIKIYQFNVIEPFWVLFKEARKITVILVSIFMAQSFWFPDL